MNNTIGKNEPFCSYPVWDRSVRIFHWVNVLCIIGLMGLGMVLLYDKALGVSSDGKIMLKTLHAYIGYVFVINLVWRLVWGFFANEYSKWKALLPFTRGYVAAFSAYVHGFKSGNPPAYAGHNPVAKLMVCLMFLLLTTQAVTGLTLAGTDLYFPPFGHEIAEWVSAAGEDQEKLAALKPGSQEGVDPESYKDMRAFRKPFVTTHEFTFYLLAIMIVIHILGVVVTEIKEKCGLISAMFTGDKVFRQRPVDLSDEKDP